MSAAMSNSQRKILSVTGSDAQRFLQDLISNNISQDQEGLVYAALLSPQGKFLVDFFVLAIPGGFLLDCDSAFYPVLKAKLTMYKLRADVILADSPLFVHRGLNPCPTDGFADPRHDALGWRAYRNDPSGPDTVDWQALRVAHMIPKAGVELIANESFILEMGFARINGVDFKKGCYVGQEVTARMHHKTRLRKGLARISAASPIATGAEITASGKIAGQVHSVSGHEALAYLRYDRIGPDLVADGVAITVLERI